MSLVAGVDCSTQSTKVVVVDTDGGSIVASASRPNAVTGAGGARESDPAAWAESMAGALWQTGKASEISAISVAAQQHGLVVLDDAGEVLRPAILWNDTRAVGEASSLIGRLGGPDRCAQRVGSVLTPAFTVASWAWLRKTEPGPARRATRICLPHDYLTALLTGGPVVTDRSDASGTGWWSPADEDYAEDVLSLTEVGIDRQSLPAVLAPGEPAGTVSEDAATYFGVPRGAVVGPGAGDNAAAALSLALKPGEAALSLGTSGTAFTVSETPSADSGGVVAGFASADGRYLPLACTLNATLAVDEVARLFGLAREDVAPAGETVFLPWLDGERTPNLPSASGALVGLRHGTDPRSILQAAYEGAAATLLGALARISRWAPLDDQAPLLVIGGGARNTVWREVIGRLSGRPLLFPEAGELVAMGAAVQAAAVALGLSFLEVAEHWATRRGSAAGAVPRDDETLDRISRWSDVVGRYFPR